MEVGHWGVLMVFTIELHMPCVASGVFRHVCKIKFVTPSSISITHAAGTINLMVTGGGVMVIVTLDCLL